MTFVSSVSSYPDATPEELSASDVCIICREEMTSGCKKLPCNHIFHKSCLRSWFQRQQSCPTCRMDIIHATRPQPQQPAPAAPPVGPPQHPAVPQFPGTLYLRSNCAVKVVLCLITVTTVTVIGHLRSSSLVLFTIVLYATLQVAKQVVCCNVQHDQVPVSTV